jgi:fructokinase
MSDPRRLIGGIEAGGTKFVCAVGDEDGTIVRLSTVPTTDPDATLAKTTAFFQRAATELGPVDALGIASFGPLDLDPASPGRGGLTRTPKPGWSGINLRARLSEALGCPVAIDTDVNGAGLAEAALGAGRGMDCFAYLTVGTGIGGGLVIDQRPVHGLIHPEMGHLLVRRHPADEAFPGCCPFHRDCLEGLASGTAILRRQGHSLSANQPDDPIWDIVADYIGQLCAALFLLASPQRIIIGGGVMSSGALFPLVRAKVARQLNGYLGGRNNAADFAELIVPPALGDRAGITGALLMGAGALPPASGS